MKICHTCQQTYSDDVEFCPRDGTRPAAKASEIEAQLAAGLSRRFRLVRRLGAGGMGTVFLAQQIGVGNRPVALKVLNRKLLDDPDFLLRFQNEAGSTGRIHHTNVVTIYESGQADDGTPYIAMEFLEGESLREVLKRRGALPVIEVAEILQQTARGLNAAHKLGIIHRDLKPDNIFLTRGDEGELVVKIVDFGIAKLRESAMHTQTGMVLGTPAYMSYEQASGMRSDELDARSDVYSLGVVVYEMLTGRTPFHSDTLAGYLRMHMLEDPPPFRAVAPALPVPGEVEAVVMKSLTKNRDERYSTALEVARDFARAASVPGRAETSTLGPTEVVDTLDRNRAEQERLTHEKAEAERRDKDKAEAELAMRKEAFQERLARAKAEIERREKEKFALQMELDKRFRERSARTRAEAESREKEKARQQSRAESAPPGKLKFVTVVVAALAVLVLIVTEIRYFSTLANPPVGKPQGRFGSAQTGTGHQAPVVKTPASTSQTEIAPKPPAPAPGKARENPKDGLKYVWIPPGTFMMGCSTGDSECFGLEKPPHQVTITKGFWLGQTEVTVAAYRRFVGSTGAQMLPAPHFNPGWNNQDMPIVNVSWDDATTFCGWAGGRLPTEAEWEYAARAGSTEARYGPTDEVAWYSSNSGQRTHEVAQKRSNAFGLYDMLGNVWEWVNDWYGENYYPASPERDPRGPDSGPTRVLRGGSWSNGSRFIRVSDRGRFYRVLRGIDNGFRCGGEVFPL